MMNNKRTMICKGTRLGLALVLALTALLALSIVVLAAGPAYDDADDPAYNPTWDNGDNGGYGFSAWALTASSSDAGHYVGSSTDNNSGGDANGDGDIDTNGKAWAMFAYNGALAEAERALTTTMATGDRFHLLMDSGSITDTGRVGFELRNTGGRKVFAFYLDGSDATYTIEDVSGVADSGISATDEGLDITLLLTDTTTGGYQLIVATLEDGNAYVHSGNLISAIGGRDIAQVYLFNDASGDAETTDYVLFFNAMELVPCDGPQDFVVTSAAQGGRGTLLNAVLSANACTGGTITFDVATLGSTAVLSAGMELPIARDLTIIGPGLDPNFWADQFTLSGEDAYRVFSVGDGVTATISGLAINDGYAPRGGGLLNAGHLTLNDVMVKGNATHNGVNGPSPTAGGQGGGIYNTGRLTMLSGTLRNNRTGSGGVSSSAGTSAAGGRGGGLYNAGGVVVLTDVDIRENQAGDGGSSDFSFSSVGGAGGAGGAIYSTGPLTLDDCHVALNDAGYGGRGGRGADATGSTNGGAGKAGGAGGHGGAIYSYSTLTITHSSFSSNTAGGGGAGGDGGFAMDGVGGAGGVGGAIYSRRAMTISDSSFYNNRAGDGGWGNWGGGGVSGGNGGAGGNGGRGGAVFIVSDTGTYPAHLIRVSMDSNIGGSGGPGGFGGYAASNAGDGGNGGLGGHGGAIYNANPNFYPSNVVATYNSAGWGGDAGGPGGDGGAGGSGGQGGHGGGLINYTPGVTRMSFTTFANNFSGSGGQNWSGTYAADGRGGGVYVVASGGTSNVRVASSVLGNNTRPTSGDGSDCYIQSGSVTSQGYNVVEASVNCYSSFSQSGDRRDVDTGLLAGSPYYLLGNESLAIDHGNPPNCPDVDFRSLPRDDWRCDSGGYELRYEDAHFNVDPWVGKGPYVTRATFGPTLISVTLESGLVGEVRAYKYDEHAPNFDEVGMPVYWELWSNSGNDYNVTVDLCYTEDDVSGINEAGLRAYRWDHVEEIWSPVTSTVMAEVNCVRVPDVTDLVVEWPEATLWTVSAVDPYAQPVLNLTKSVTPAADVAHHGIMTYTVSLNNLGTLDDTNVLFTDTLPAAVSFGGFVGTSHGASVTGNAISWSGTVYSNTARTWVFTAAHIGDYAETVTNTAYFSGTLDAGSAEAAFTVEPNYAPVLDPVGAQAVDQGDTLAFTASASDANVNDSLTFSLDAGSVGSITPDGVYTWATDGSVIPGIYTATVRVSDGALDDVEMINITVNAICIESVALGITNVGDIYTNTVANFSADLSPNHFTRPFTYTFDYGDGTAPVSGNSSANPFEFTHTYAITGVYTVEFAAWNCAITETFTDSVTVTVVERPVAALDVFKSVSPAEDVAYHGTVTYTMILANIGTMDDPSVSFTDTLPAEVNFGGFVGASHGASVAGNTLTWSGPLGAGEDLTWVFTAAHVGDYAETVTNTAEFSGTLDAGSAEAAFTVEPNYAPLLEPIGAQVIDQGDTLTFTASATDANVNDSLTFSLDAESVGSITPAGAYTWSPAGAGVYTATVRVTDGALDHAETISITVNAVCVPLSDVNLAITNTGTIYTDTAVYFSANLGPDAFTAPYSYTLDYGDGTLPVSGNSSAVPYRFDATYTTPGTYTVTFAAWNCAMTEPITDSITFTVYTPDVCVGIGDVTLSLLTTGDIYTGTVANFEADLIPNDMTLPYTYTIDYGDGTISGPASGTSDPHVFTSTYTVPGTYTVTFAAWNCAMTTPLTSSVVVTVQPPINVCIDIEAVELALLTAGTVYTDTQLTFGAAIAPDDASKPYTYTLDYGDGTSPLSGVSSADPFTFTHTYTATGTYTATFAAWNCGMMEPVTATVTVTVYEKGVCVDIGDIELNLLTSGDISPGAQVTWQAILVPPGASVPYSYTLDYGDGSTPANGTGYDNPFQFSYTYGDPATYTVTVSAWNCGMTEPVSATLPVTVHTPSKIYLPLVVRSQ